MESNKQWEDMENYRIIKISAVQWSQNNLCGNEDDPSAPAPSDAVFGAWRTEKLSGFFLTVYSEEEPPADGRCVFHVEGARCRLPDKTEKIPVYTIPNTKCRKRF